MKILVVGAGAIGGYFGGRLLQAGCDVTFLVRPRRAEELARDGLVIRSPAGDAHLPAPPTVLATNLKEPFDLVLLSCKAFDLDDAIASFAPAVGAQTAILPLLNGMKHISVLAERFGDQAVLGGQCQIAATLNDKRQIVHMSPMLSMSFGERNGELSSRVQSIMAQFEKGNFNARASTEIMQEMFEKWTFLATLAGCTSAMRGAVGHIVASPGGRDFILGVRAEIAAVAAAEGHAPRPASVERTIAMLTEEGSPLTASMYRDLQAGSAIETDHVIGDLIVRGDRHKVDVPRLRMIYTNLKCYEAQRA